MRCLHHAPAGARGWNQRMRLHGLRAPAASNLQHTAISMRLIVGHNPRAESLQQAPRLVVERPRSALLGRTGMRSPLLRWLVPTAGAAAAYGAYQRCTVADASAPTAPSPYYLLDETAASLKAVQIVFRHGARTPLTDKAHLWAGHVWDVCGQAYKGVPLEISSREGPGRPVCADDEKQVGTKLPGNCHKGELTLVGQRQALDLGQWLRQRYVDQLRFMQPSYEAGSISARTTNYQRTIATLRGVLTGLYEGQEQPIPVRTSTALDEILFADSRTCPHLKQFMRHAKMMLTSQAQRDPQRNQLIGELSAALGLQLAFFGERWHFSNIHDVMTSLAAHGKPLPEGLTPALLDQVNQLATKEFAAFVSPSLADEHGEAVIRLSMGRLLDLLVANMDGAAAAAAAAAGQQRTAAATSGGGGGGGGPRMFMYSGHDSTIMPLLQALGQDIVTWPLYLSNVIFELWELPSSSAGSSSSSSTVGSKVHVVRVLYNRHELPLPGCPPGHALELGHFKEQVLGSFLLSEEDHANACMVAVDHGTSLPQPAIALSSPQQDSQ